jgi:glutathione S-transferase
MRLIGMLDSPYVRRVAVSLKLMGLPFEHEPVSVFRHYERFRAINPVVKAPTLVCDDGTVLMDSTLILDHAESLVAPERRLMSAPGPARLAALRLIGFALAACEKCVQVVYEKERRAVVDAAWMERIVGQANAGFEVLERDAQLRRRGVFDAADVAIACTWRFSQYYDAAEIAAARYPQLVAHSARAEAMPEFTSTPLD